MKPPAEFPTERTRDLYEEIDGYPKPRLVPLPDPDDLSDLRKLGMTGSGIAWRLLRTALVLSGFKSFQRELPKTVEDLLRRTNTRGPMLFPPIVSATMALEDDPRNLPPLDRATTLLAAAVGLYRDIFSARLAPDRYRDEVLEMGQYPNLFATNVAFEGKRPRMFKSTNDSYVVVVVGRRFFRLDISDLDSETGVERVRHHLASIAHQARDKPRRNDDPSPGLLTCGRHRTQTKGFRKLSREAVNAGSLEIMKHNFLTLCLELDEYPASYEEAARVTHSLNCGNRWHLSSLQLVVFGNGKVCVICDFNAYLDGNTMARAGSELWRRGIECRAPVKERTARGNASELTELRWRVSPRLAMRARNDMTSVRDGQRATYTLEGLGRDALGARGLDPVPVFTLALQVVMKRLVGHVPRFDQFLTMTRYRCMGVATANVTTPEAVRFVDYFDGGSVDAARALDLLGQAVDSQLEACRSVRRVLPPGQRLALFSHSRKGLRRFYALPILAPTLLLLRALSSRSEGREVVLSHPTIYPGVPVFGRPGVRLPYVRFFGLHYQIFDHSTVLTVMPGRRWSVPNGELMAELQVCLERLRATINNWR